MGAVRLERPLVDGAAILEESSSMQAIRAVIESVADTDATILLRGETGSGKDFIARAIHARSARCHGPFVKVNCAALPSGLLESELFGHERGAFTGAHRRRLGQFEYANHGTIYLDEVAEIPTAFQAKLLHILQDLRFARVGGHGLIEIDTRVIAATNRNLEVALARGEFREDLYYRLNVVDLHIPPLRERRDEIPRLAALFLARFNGEYGRQKQLSAETLARLNKHVWPGNIRELENVIRRMVLLTDGEQAFETQFRRGSNGHTALPGAAAPGPAAPGPAAVVTESLRDTARRAAREAEGKALVEVLESVRWNRAEASRILKVSYKTLLHKIAECGLAAPI